MKRTGVFLGIASLFMLVASVNAVEINNSQEAKSYIDKFPSFIGKELLTYDLQESKVVTQVFGGFYQIEPGTTYYSPIEGYAAIGLSHNLDGTYTMEVITFKKNIAMRCERNKLLPPLFYENYYDYSGECN